MFNESKTPFGANVGAKRVARQGFMFTTMAQQSLFQRVEQLCEAELDSCVAVDDDSKGILYASADSCADLRDSRGRM